MPKAPIRTTCSSLGCFDCASLTGRCSYSNGECKQETNKVLNDWSNVNAFQKCPDYRNWCLSNMQNTTSYYNNSTVAALEDKQTLYFTLGTITGMDIPDFEDIPSNYFCSWSVTLDPKTKYSITITRNDGIYEDLMFVVSDDQRQEIITNTNLISRNGESLEKFQLVSANSLDIYVRNVYNTTRNTFIIEVDTYKGSSSGPSPTFIAQLTSIIVVICCFVTLTSCLGLVLRFRRRAAQQRYIEEQENAFAQRHNIRVEEARQILALARQN